ncbi:uncharacterized protein (DUF1499 family) [Sphingomonas kaistensis]|uniref:Uncharacterized protein (DUF1499 family) n=1 Tax=Sphingomonas kaistensis TaxID=298708 RepID=A0A7X5Y699_9SPHN|nr:DUF1499 domain-containing protein [Sphingomonas kaistensis]NJC05869.1 uncharacterized protein (DUF1499 family) [Sphingomonas kaistensis]
MIDHGNKGRWPRRLSRIALALSVGGVAVAAIAAVGTGTGLWSYGAGLGALRYALPLALLGGLLAIVAWIVGRRQGVRTGWLNGLALVTALLFAGYLGSMIFTARSMPAIHDVATDLDDLPQFSRLTVRGDNLDKIPDQGRAELKAMPPEERWKALHRQAYGDLKPLRLSAEPGAVLQRAEQLARERGWTVAAVDPAAGTMEATATTLFFRFKDDVVVRVRPDPSAPGGSLVDMRSISRVGVSDIGVNAKRVRRFLADLKEAMQ